MLALLRGVGHGLVDEGRIRVGQTLASEVIGQDVRREPRHVALQPERGEPLEGAVADVAVAEADEHRAARRRRLVAAVARLAGRALQRQAAVAGAAPRRRPRPLGAEVHQPAGRIAALGEEEAAAVAEVGIVHAELVAVVAQRQRRLEAAGQRFEPREVADPSVVVEAVESDRRRRPVVPEAHDRLGEVGRRDGIVEVGAEVEDRPRGPEDHAGGRPHAVRTKRTDSSTIVARSAGSLVDMISSSASPTSA